MSDTALAVMLICTFVIFHAYLFKQEYLKKQKRISIFLAIATVCVSYTLGLIAVALLGYIIWLLPAQLAGNIETLPWITFLPALILALWTFKKVIDIATQFMLRHFGASN